MHNKKNTYIIAGSLFLIVTVLIVVTATQYQKTFIAHMQIPRGTIVIPVPGKPKPTKDAMQMQTFPFVTATPTPTPTPIPKPVNQSIGTGGTSNLEVLKLAKAQLGKPYVWGSPSRSWSSENPATGNTPSSFDCSGLVGWSYYWATGGKIKMSGQTSADFNGSNPSLKKFGPDQRALLQPGDILYWSAGNFHHTALYEGPGACGGPHCFIEAQQTGVPLKESNLDTHKDPLAGFLRPI